MTPLWNGTGYSVTKNYPALPQAYTPFARIKRIPTIRVFATMKTSTSWMAIYIVFLKGEGCCDSCYYDIMWMADCLDKSNNPDKNNM